MNYEFLIFIPENAPEDLVNLACVFGGDISQGIGDVFVKFCEDRDGILKMLKTEYDGVYLDGDVYQYPFDKENNVACLEYPLKVVNLNLYNIFVKLHNNKSTFINKIGLETAMAKQAPYKLWTIEALKNECTQRKFDPATYKNVSNKNVLVKALELNDAEGKKESAPAPVVEKKTVKAPVVEKKTVKAPPVPKKKTEEKAEAPVVETEKAEKPKRPAPDLSSVVNLNQKLRDAGLWKTGCQFLTTDEKNKLIAAKTDKERKAIYDALEKKRTTINATLSEKMKGKSVAKKAQSVEEAPVEEAPVEEAPVEEAPVVEKKVPVPPPAKKKTPPVPGKKIVNKK